MASAIWKYALPVEPGKSIDIDIPVGSKIIYFAWQNDAPAIWVMVGALRTMPVKRKFAVVGTGWELPEDAVYIDTFMVKEFVWRVVEQKMVGHSAT